MKEKKDFGLKMKVEMKVSSEPKMRRQSGSSRVMMHSHSER